jgi:hypothetical protein
MVTNRGTISKTVPSAYALSDHASLYRANTNGFSALPTTYTFGVNSSPKWLAGGEGTNTLAYSTDGIRWTGKGTSPLTTRVNDIAYNGTTWVIVGTSGSSPYAYYSFNGDNWTSCPTFTAAEGQRVKWNGQMFVATTKSATIYYSYNGIQWTAVTLSGSGISDVNALDWNGVFWMLGCNSSTANNQFHKSFDGVSWAATTMSGFAPTNVRSLTWTGSNWIASGVIGSGNASAYSTNIDATSWNTFTVAGMTTGVTSIAYNNQIYVAAGITTGNTMAYSYDGQNWTSLGVTVFGNTTNYITVEWANNKFIAVGGIVGITSRIAYSFDGIRWTLVSGADTLFSVAARAIEYGGNKFKNTIKFPQNLVMSGNLCSRNGGVSWTAINSTQLTTVAQAIGFNGSQFIFGNSASSKLTIDLSGNATYGSNFVTMNFGQDPTTVNVIKSNKTMWLMGGVTSTAGNQLKRSYDGFTWITTSNIGALLGTTPISGLAWNGSLWVASAGTFINASSANNIMLYSFDGINWTVGKNASTGTTMVAGVIGGAAVEWTGSMFISVFNTGVAQSGVCTSTDGITWTTPRAITGSNSLARCIACNNNSILLGCNAGNDGTRFMFYYSSNGGSTWTNNTLNTTGSLASVTAVSWTGTNWIAVTAAQTYTYSYDGVTWTALSGVTSGLGNNLLWTRPSEGTVSIMHPTVAGGAGINTLAVSADGLNFTGLGSSVFTTRCNSTEWNGSIWVAGGSGLNTLAWSYDGKTWTGLGTTIFTTSANRIVWNGTVWLALGSGTNSLATSVDGKVWTGLGSSIFTIGESADWNGTAWVAVGSGDNNIAYSTNANASTWTGIGKSGFIFTNSGYDVRWVLNRWIALGRGTNNFITTTVINGSSGWAAVTTPPTMAQGNALDWNGRLIVAVGQGTNTIATSTDGLVWTGLGSTIFSTEGSDVTWNEDRWILVGQGTNTIAHSFDGANFFANPTSTNVFSTSGNGVNSRARMGVTVPSSSLYLKSGDTIMVSGPEAYDSALSSDTNISFSLLQSE